ncbi:MAG TPA: HEPN domain-containing protein [Pirellulales bacterium]|jgi:HEPN domain-containing protein|nr:HEPN domain-containing protein [Pirellulales bacterium]
MSLPRGKNARTFYRAAKQRFSDAELLLEHNRTTSAVYLAGYGVECMLKALMLESVPESRHDTIGDLFRGQLGHNLILLMRELRTHLRGSLPSIIERTLLRVNTWTTNLRYMPGNIKSSLATEYIRDAAQIIQWTDERI